MPEPYIKICVQREDFSATKESASLCSGRFDIGAVLSFTGVCRDEDGTLEALELEHYPQMAEEELTRIAKTAVNRWSLQGMVVVHRFGKIFPGENIVLVIAVSKHRQASFDGANFMMDFLKTRAPFWKKEHRLVDGDVGNWVSAKDADDDALIKWN